MMMPGRNYTAGNGYRYGFNGKENDNDVKGVEGSQLDYGMRIYDPRLGRFLSVDPLTKSYPMLTPYQFASNSPIAGIDLDGLEFYYTADGKLHGHKTAHLTNNKPIPANISDQLRVAHNIKDAGNYTTFSYQMFHEANEITRNKILNTIYQTYIMGKVPPTLTTKDDGNPNESGTTAQDKSYMNIDASHQRNGEYLFDNLYNLVNTTYHESLHFKSKGSSSYSFAHYDILKKQTSHSSWQKTTANYKDYIKGVAEGYISDMESLTVGVASFVDHSSDRKSIFKTKQDEASFNKYYADYVSAIEHFNKTFNEKKEIKSKADFQKVFSPPTQKKG
jgi:RHS repeat-associated protein